MRRWRGLKSLVVDAVDHGSRAVERIQRETASVPFDLLEKIPVLAEPAKGVRLVHDTALSATHGMIRLVNRGVGAALDVVFDVVEAQSERAGVGDRRPLRRRADVAGVSEVEGRQDELKVCSDQRAPTVFAGRGARST